MAPTWPRSTGPGSKPSRSGQMEAARSLGMSHRQAMRNVIVPQAIRKVFAPLLNDLIALMKDTTLVSVIALNEVLLVGRDIYTETYNSSAITLGAILFLVVTLPLARMVDPLISREQGAHVVPPRLVHGGRPERWPTPMLEARGDPQTLRRSRGPARHRPRGHEGRSRLRHRAERLRQEHDAALHQPARAPREGRDLPRGPRHLQGPRLGRRRVRLGRQLSPPAGRDGLPAIQPLPPPDGPRRT